MLAAVFLDYKDHPAAPILNPVQRLAGWQFFNIKKRPGFSTPGIFYNKNLKTFFKLQYNIIFAKLYPWPSYRPLAQYLLFVKNVRKQLPYGMYSVVKQHFSI